MATQTEIAAELRDTSAKLAVAVATIKKVGAETDSLISKIDALESAIANGEVSQEVREAFESVKEQADAVEAAVTVVDLKVPDAPPEPSPPTPPPTT